MSERHDVWTLLDGLQMDLRAANAKLTSLRSLVAGMNLAPPTRVECPSCGITVRGDRTLAEHRYQMHDGPLPPHWQEPADALAELDPEDFAAGPAA